MLIYNKKLLSRFLLFSLAVFIVLHVVCLRDKLWRQWVGKDLQEQGKQQFSAWHNQKEGKGDHFDEVRPNITFSMVLLPGYKSVLVCVHLGLNEPLWVFPEIFQAVHRVVEALNNRMLDRPNLLINCKRDVLCSLDLPLKVACRSEHDSVCITLHDCLDECLSVFNCILCASD
jgi:hypothetical protein